MLKKDYLLAKIGVDTAENEPRHRSTSSWGKLADGLGVEPEMLVRAMRQSEEGLRPAVSTRSFSSHS